RDHTCTFMLVDSSVKGLAQGPPLGDTRGQAPLKQEADVSLVMVSYNETEWNSQQLLALGSPLPQSQEFSENRQVLPEHGPAFQAPSSHGDRVIISGDQLPVEPSTEYQFPLLKKPYTCSTCEKVFQYASTLRSHLRTHTGEKPFSCETCGKNFTCSSNLKVHMRIHTGEKPYTCQTCGRAFSNQGHLRYHTKIHTGKAQNPVKKLHSCETCGKTYTSRASLPLEPLPLRLLIPKAGVRQISFIFSNGDSGDCEKRLS
uniref:C2H2-type domain-containing protein n=1 Tax=Oryzias latipes TaxID=8090 RepID=A0A3P9LC23_ORYLA